MRLWFFSEMQASSRPHLAAKLPLVASLAGHREHTLNVGAMCRLLERRISEERSNGCEAEVPGPPRGGSLRLKVFQECADERSVQIPQCQLRWGSPDVRTQTGA